MASTCNSSIVCHSCFKSGHMAKCENFNTPGENATVPPPPPPTPTRTNGRAQPASRPTEGASSTTGVRGPAAGTERNKRTRSASRSPESEKHEKKREKVHVSWADSHFLPLLAVYAANSQRETGERTATGGKGGWHLMCIASVL